MTTTELTEMAMGPVHWTATGPVDAPAIVFVHGAMMGRSVWAPQIARLQDRYRCIAVDQPGHGTLRSDPFTIDRAVSNIMDALDREAGGRAVVVGLSLGGYVAMTLAGRHPERVRGLVISGCTREPVGLSRLGFHAYSWSIRLIPERLVRMVALRWFRLRYGREIATTITAGGHFSSGGARAVGHLTRWSFRARLLAYGGLVLAINGATDLVFTFGARRFLAGVPNVRYDVIPRAGHLSNVDAPDRFTALLEEFIATLPA